VTRNTLLSLHGNSQSARVPVDAATLNSADSGSIAHKTPSLSQGLDSWPFSTPSPGVTGTTRAVPIQSNRHPTHQGFPESCRRLSHRLRQSDQVVRRATEGKQPAVLQALQRGLTGTGTPNRARKHEDRGGRGPRGCNSGQEPRRQFHQETQPSSDCTLSFSYS
jgi:hypothetical protein